MQTQVSTELSRIQINAAVGLHSKVSQLYFPHLKSPGFQRVFATANSSHNAWRDGQDDQVFCVMRTKNSATCKFHAKTGLGLCHEYGPVFSDGRLHWFDMHGPVMVPTACHVLGGALEGKSTWVSRCWDRKESCTVSFVSSMLHGEATVSPGYSESALPLLLPPPLGKLIHKTEVAGWWFYNEKCKNKSDFDQRVERYYECIVATVASTTAVQLPPRGLHRLVASYLDYR